MSVLVFGHLWALSMATQPIKTLVWNVRGLNAPARRNAVFQVVTAANPSIVCLQETKLDVVTTGIVAQCLGNKFENFYYLSSNGTRGGILLAWDSMAVQLSNPHYTVSTVIALVKPVGSADQWWVTGLYGP